MALFGRAGVAERIGSDSDTAEALLKNSNNSRRRLRPPQARFRFQLWKAKALSPMSALTQQADIFWGLL